MHCLRFSLIFLALLAVSGCRTVDDNADQNSSGSGSTTVTRDPNSGSTPALALTGGSREDAVSRARGHLKSHADKVPHDGDHEFIVRDVITDEGGREHVRFDRKYRGMRVVGGDLVVHSSASGEFISANVAFSRGIAVGKNANLTPPQAVAKAKTAWPGGTVSTSTHDLVIFAGDDSASLAYEVVLTGTLADGSPSELHVFIDANSGTVLAKWDGIVTAAGTGQGYLVGTVALETTPITGGFSLTDATRGNQKTLDMGNKQGGSGKLFTDSDNVWGSGTLANRATVAVDAQFGAAATWDYFRSQHQRNGIKNNGIGAASRVHFGRSYNNAYWSDSCFCMTYGDGDGVTFNPFTSIDVAGHEMTHGVTAMTANLVYSGESGGLNEATSDIFGTMVEFSVDQRIDAPDYLIGERLYKSGTKSLRYMYKPSLDTRSPDCYTSTLGSLDVHYSSGVANHFFYLLAEGSSPAGGLPESPTCNQSVITGIGRSDAARIWYKALTVYMTSSTKYAGARIATLQAATDLFGAGSPQVLAVAAAWSAVSVN